MSFEALARWVMTPPEVAGTVPLTPVATGSEFLMGWPVY